jgi:hypothetical protein
MDERSQANLEQATEHEVGDHEREEHGEQDRLLAHEQHEPLLGLRLLLLLGRCHVERPQLQRAQDPDQ